jgi:hypothetical protein
MCSSAGPPIQTNNSTDLSFTGTGSNSFIDIDTLPIQPESGKLSISLPMERIADLIAIGIASELAEGWTLEDVVTFLIMEYKKASSK